MAETTGKYLLQGAKQITDEFFFSGTVALEKGQALCFDSDRGTATAVNQGRGGVVELPTVTNNRWFAGVTDKAYNANAQGQRVLLHRPGSFCEVAIAVDTVINVGILGFSVMTGAAGLWVGNALPGRGSARILQTNASGTEFSSLDGTASLAADGITLTKTGIGTASTVGDLVYILGGNTAAGAAAATVGQYTVATAPSANVITLSSAAAAAVTLVNVVTRSATSKPRCFVELLDGVPESGGVQWTVPMDNAASTPVPMVGGMTLVAGGFTIGAGDSTATLADGTIIGEQKGFLCMGALTTQDFLLTVTSGQKSADNATLATIELDAALEGSILTWYLSEWRAQTAATGTEA